MYGANSAGKSSVLHALALAHHAIHTGDADVERTRLGGDAIDLGGFRQYVHLRDPQRIVQLGFELDLGAAAGRPFRGVRTAVCKVDLGFTPKARHLQVAVRPGTTLADASYIAADVLVAEGSEQEVDPTRDQELDHWLIVDTQPEVEIDWDGGVRLQRFALDTAGEPLLCLSNHGGWGFDVAWNHPAIGEIVRQQLGESRLNRHILRRVESPWVTTSPHRLVPRLELNEHHVSKVRHQGRPGSPADPAPDDSLVRILYGVVNNIGATLEAEFGRLIYLGPLRYWPARSDTFAQRADLDWFAGAAAWEITRTDSHVRRQVNEWLGTEHLLKTPYRLELRDAARHDVRHTLHLVDTRSGTTVSARDVGAGISQVLPILMSAFAVKDHLLAIEQPEVNLHPALQAELGDVFLRSALDRGNTLLVETHSEHLLLRIMRRLRETAAGDLPDRAPAVRPEDVMVLFVEPDGPRSIIREMPLNERGELVKAWPGGFFEEGLREMF